MTPAAEIFTAVQILRGQPADTPEMPEPYRAPLIAWLLSVHDELSRVDHAADMYGEDPLNLVDNPDSVHHALAVARALNPKENPQ